MSRRARAFGPVLFLAVGCSSAPEMQLDLRSDPQGAQVYLSRRGMKSVEAKVSFLEGDVKAETLEEEFMLLGTAPLAYSFPLEEIESDATVLGVGAKVLLKYKEGVLRFEKPGFETVERRIRVEDGELAVHVSMEPEPDPVDLK